MTIPPDEEDMWSLLADSYYYVVMVFALAGIPFWFSIRDKRKLLLVLFLLAWTGAHLLFVPGPRYHAPLMPLFSIWAAVAAVTLLSQAMERLKGQRRPVDEEVS